MKVNSQITTGFRTDGGSGPLIRQGEWDFEGRTLSTQERALVYALRDASMLTIVEDAPPAEVVPIDAARRKRASPTAVAAQAAAEHALTAEAPPPKKAKKRRVART